MCDNNIIMCACTHTCNPMDVYFKRTKTIWESPSGKIKVCYSDIMKDGFDKRNKEEKLFVIPVNSCFDTIVDEDISTCSKPLVSPNSLHGRWIKQWLIRDLL